MFGARHLRPARGSATAIRWRWPRARREVALRALREARRAVLLLPRPRRRARGRRRCAETNASLDRVVEHARGAAWRAPASQLLWGTANLFSHPRYAAGAATNPDPEVFAYAAAQVKKALEATHRLRRRQLRAVGRPRGLRHAAQHRPAPRARAARPLPAAGRRAQAPHRLRRHDPDRAQADGADQAPVRLRRRRRCTRFLRRFGLENEIKLNIEANHATLAGHSFQHEIAYARRQRPARQRRRQPRRPAERLGHRPVPEQRRGDDAGAATTILRGGGFTTGGFNFDAKLRRQSVDAGRTCSTRTSAASTRSRAALLARRGG